MTAAALRNKTWATGTHTPAVSTQEQQQPRPGALERENSLLRPEGATTTMSLG